MTGPPQIYYYLQIAVPAIIIIAGWFVIYNNSLKIESRKEARDFVDKIENLIDSLQHDINQYYSVNENHIGNYSSNIKAKFLLLSHYLFILKSLGINFRGSRLLTEFKKSATGGYFETQDFRKQAEIPGWEADLASLAAQIKLALRRSYFEWTQGTKLVSLPKLKR